MKWQGREHLLGELIEQRKKEVKGMRKALMLLLILSSLYLIGCGGLAGVSQNKSTVVSAEEDIPQATESQNTKPKGNTLRELIAGTTIRVLITKYTYDFLPFGERRTLIITRDDWFPYVNSHLQGLCIKLGGEAFAKTRNVFTGQITYNREAKSHDGEWKCEGGKDPFILHAYKSNLGGRTLSGVAKDVYIVVDHEKPQPMLFTEEVGRLYQKYKTMDTSNWLKFFKSQDKGLLGGLWSFMSSKAAWLSARIMKDGTIKAEYDVEGGYFGSVMGRLYPVVHLASLCYAKGGTFKEGNPEWVKEWAAKGYYATHFYCEGGSQPFTVKIEPVGRAYNLAGEPMSTITVAVYIKEGLHNVIANKTEKPYIGLNTGYEDTVAVTVAKTKSYFEEVREPYKYQGIYLMSQGNCDIVGVIVSPVHTQRRDIYTITVCNGIVKDKKVSVPITGNIPKLESMIQQVKAKTKIMGAFVGKYHNYLIIGRAYGSNLCKVEIRIMNGAELADWRLYDECG